MTNPRNRELDRAVRAYKRSHPGITLDEARQAVAARSAAPVLPARIPGTPLPRPAERLEGYVQRVAAAIGVQQHRAMELLGLQPGTSATDRLDHLAADPLPDDTVQALTAATGMTAEQARALTAPRPARPDLEAVRRITEANFDAGHYRRGGEGKTSTAPGELAAALALVLARRARMTDTVAPGTPQNDVVGQRPLLFDLPGSNVQWAAPYRPVIADLDWPGDLGGPATDPAVFDAVAKALGLDQDADTGAPPRE
ncbi:TniQ family protein [Streptomyces sp. NPDC059063]|uniref:TniQ family protein n=1 Tax=unclassified Streptomyces TaxID=2593676 RepID=UPI0036CC62CE